MTQPLLNQSGIDEATMRGAFASTYPFIPWDRRFSCEDWAHKARLFEGTWAAATATERARCCGIIFGQCASDNVAQRTVDAIRGTPGRKRQRAPEPVSAWAPAECAPVALSELSGDAEAMTAQLMAVLPDLGGSVGADCHRESVRSALSIIIWVMLAKGQAVTYQSLGGLLVDPQELSRMAETLPHGAVRSAALALIWGYDQPGTGEFDAAKFNAVIGAVTGRVTAMAMALRAACPARHAPEA